MSEPLIPTTAEIIQKVQSAKAKFLQWDSDLLEINVNERTMTHKLAEYLQQEFVGWNVDCEYNRNINDEKWLPQPPEGTVGREFWQDSDAKTVFPDIIVHQRRTNTNILVIEAKKSSNRDRGAWDETKLRAFKNPPYNYLASLFVKFLVAPDHGIEIREL